MQSEDEGRGLKNQSRAPARGRTDGVRYQQAGEQVNEEEEKERKKMKNKEMEEEVERRISRTVHLL